MLKKWGFWPFSLERCISFAWNSKFRSSDMVEKNHLVPFFSHLLKSILSKIMQFSNHVILGSANLHGSVSASKWSISSTLPPKCNPFPWKVSNFEILSLESGSSVSPNFDFFNFQPIFKFKIEFKLFKWYIGSFFTHFVQKPCQFLDLTTVNMQKMPF